MFIQSLLEQGSISLKYRARRPFPVQAIAICQVYQCYQRLVKICFSCTKLERKYKDLLNTLSADSVTQVFPYFLVMGSLEALLSRLGRVSKQYFHCLGIGLALKPSFHYPVSIRLPVNTGARSTSQYGPCRRVMETGQPSTRAVNSGRQLWQWKPSFTVLVSVLVFRPSVLVLKSTILFCFHK